MSEDKIVEVEGLTSENATLLLAAAEELEQDAGVVRTTSYGRFEVPESVAKKAGVDYQTAEDREAAAQKQAEKQAAAEAKAEAKPPRKTAAKTAASKNEE